MAPTQPTQPERISDRIYSITHLWFAPHDNSIGFPRLASRISVVEWDVCVFDSCLFESILQRKNESIYNADDRRCIVSITRLIVTTFFPTGCLMSRFARFNSRKN